MLKLDITKANFVVIYVNGYGHAIQLIYLLLLKNKIYLTKANFVVIYVNGYGHAIQLI